MRFLATRKIARAPMAPQMECPVCLRDAPLHSLPCHESHRFCASCMLPVLLATGLRCPLCRAVATGVPLAPPRAARARVVTLTPSDAHPYAGVTVCNAAGGVRIQRLHASDLFASALRVGQTLTSINGVPCVHHSLVVRQVDECCRRRVPMRLVCTGTTERLRALRRGR